MKTSIFTLLLILSACARSPQDGLTQITQESIKKKEGIEIQIVPFKPTQTPKK